MLALFVLYMLKFFIFLIVFVKKLQINAFFSLYFYYIFCSLLFVVSILIGVAFFTYLERKKLASIQSRQGPNKVGYFGIFQPIVDGVKLFIKETIVPQNSFLVVFFLSSVYAFFIGLSLWVVFPFSYRFIDSDVSYGILFVFILSILHVYSVILAG